MSLETEQERDKKAAVRKDCKSEESPGELNTDDTQGNKRSQKSNITMERKPDYCEEDWMYFECVSSPALHAASWDDLYPDVFGDPVGDISDDHIPSKFSLSLFQRLSLKDQNEQHKSSLETVDCHGHDAGLTGVSDNNRTVQKQSVCQPATAYISDERHLLPSCSKHSSISCVTSRKGKGSTGNGKIEKEGLPQHETLLHSETLIDFHSESSVNNIQSDFVATLPGKCDAGDMQASSSEVPKTGNSLHKDQHQNEKHIKHKSCPQNNRNNLQVSKRNEKPLRIASKDRAKTGTTKPRKKVFLKIEFSDSSCSSSDEEISLVHKADSKTGIVSANEDVQTAKKAPEFTEESGAGSKCISRTDIGEAMFNEVWSSASLKCNNPESGAHHASSNPSLALDRVSSQEQQSGRIEGEAVSEHSTKETSTYQCDFNNSFHSPDVFMPAPLSQRLGKRRLVSNDVLHSIALTDTATVVSVTHSKEPLTFKSAPKGQKQSVATKEQSTSDGACQRGERVMAACAERSLKHKETVIASGSLSSPIFLD